MVYMVMSLVVYKIFAFIHINFPLYIGFRFKRDILFENISQIEGYDQHLSQVFVLDRFHCIYSSEKL